MVFYSIQVLELHKIAAMTLLFWRDPVEGNLNCITASAI